MTDAPMYKRGDVVMFPARRHDRHVPLPDPEIVFGDDAEASAEAWRRYRDECSKVRWWTEVILGVVEIVDFGGALGVNEHSYDIFDPVEPCLHKRIPQSEVLGLLKEEGGR